MAEQNSEIDLNFNPEEFTVPSEWFIDRTYWEHLGDSRGCSFCRIPFYVPTARAKKAWPEKLKQIFGVEPFVVYDPAILNLPNEITAEEIEAERLECNKFVVKSREDMTPVGPPDKLSVQEYLNHKCTRLQCELSWTDKKFEDLSEKEKKIYSWKSDYGCLWDHRDGAGLLFPGPKDEKALKFEIMNEYFFHTTQFPQLILTVSQEPNTDRAIYGFRREVSLDGHLDKVWIGHEKDKNGKTRPKYVDIPEESVRREITEPMNRLIINLEYTLSK